MATDHIRWGIIGTGSIARTFASNLPHSDTGHLAAVATRNPGKPGLAENFPGARIVGYCLRARGERLRRERQIDKARPRRFGLGDFRRARQRGDHRLRNRARRLAGGLRRRHRAIALEVGLLRPAHRAKGRVQTGSGERRAQGARKRCSKISHARGVYI